ncbi:MAG: hypothetical protein AAFU71_10145 [Cyanobacteria bacterium J06632_22]
MLHGIVLRLPMRPLGTLQIPAAESTEVVPVTRLPVVASALPDVEPLPTQPAALPPPAPIPQPVAAVPAAVPARVPEPVLSEPLPTEPTVSEPTVSEPTVPAEEPIVPAQPPPSEPIPPEAPTDPPLENGTVVPFAEDFPHFANAEMGCFGLSSCGSLSGIRSYRAAAQQMVPILENQDYQIDEYSTDEPGYSVYRLSHPDWRNGESFYLSFFQDGLGQAVYVITADVVTLDELKQLV